MHIKRKPNQTDRYILADAIRHHRTAQKLTQETLAEEVGRSRRWITALELGRANPNWLDTIHFLALLDIDPKELARELGFDVPVSSH